MAEVLCMARSSTHADSAKDREGSYKKGMPVVVKPDGFAWGAEELRPPAQGGVFVRIRVSDKSVAKVEKFIEEELSGGNHFRRRRWRILTDNLPAGVRSQLNNTGFYSATWAQIRDYVEEITTQATQTGVDL